MSYGRERKPPPKIEGMHSLKVDNITARTGPNEIREVFSKFGEIGDIHIPKDRWSGENKGFAFVRFWSRRDAEDALDRMDGRRIDGREIRVTNARYGRPCDEREERRGRGGRGGGGDNDRYGRRSRSRSGGRRGGRSRSRSTSNDRRRKSPSRSRSGSRPKTSRSRSRSN